MEAGDVGLLETHEIVPWPELAAMGVTSDKATLLMCRTQVRSAQAATALTARGFARCYVVDGGFEGQPDEKKHRGTRDGWKAAGLPWVQG